MHEETPTLPRKSVKGRYSHRACSRLLTLHCPPRSKPHPLLLYLLLLNNPPSLLLLLSPHSLPRPLLAVLPRARCPRNENWKRRCEKSKTPISPGCPDLQRTEWPERTVGNELSDRTPQRCGASRTLFMSFIFMQSPLLLPWLRLFVFSCNFTNTSSRQT